MKIYAVCESYESPHAYYINESDAQKHCDELYDKAIAIRTRIKKDMDINLRTIPDYYVEEIEVK
jgi:hypothetical protein